MRPSETEPIFRDNPKRPVAWLRDPDHDIECPICLFERGQGTAWAYFCVKHWDPNKVGTWVYWCPYHQREVSSLMILGESTLEIPLTWWNQTYAV